MLAIVMNRSSSGTLNVSRKAVYTPSATALRRAADWPCLSEMHDAD
jgi:hypothetical protein